MPPHLEACLGPEGLQALKGSGACREHMVHVASREYHIGCNWKVFCDNYLVRGRGRGGCEASDWHKLCHAPNLSKSASWLQPRQFPRLQARRSLRLGKLLARCLCCL